MSSSQGELRFPLEDRFLAHARVNDNRFDEWKGVAQKDMDAVLSNPRSWYYRPNDLKQTYRPVYEQDAIRGYVKTASANSEKRELLGLAHLASTLEDLATGYIATSTADQRRVFAQLYGVTLLDGAVLRTVEHPHANDPFHYVGLKWLAFASPAPAIVSHRDYVYFECSGTTYDISNRKVLFVYQRSFPLASSELSEPDKGCARGEHYQLLFFRMEGGGVLLHGVSEYTPQADAPTWTATRVVTETFDAIKNFVGLADARAIAAAGMIKHASTPKSASENKACVGCQKKFGIVRSRHGCRSCGQSMCKHCVTTLSFFNDEAFFTAVPTILSEIFCVPCIQHARSQRQLEFLSATLTKTSIKSDAASTSSLPHDNMSGKHHHRDELRATIGREVGMTPSDSGSDAGSTRSQPSHSRYHSGSPASTSYASSAGAPVHHAPPNPPAMAFEQMNESIRQQEEILMVLQQERAKRMGRPAYPMAAPVAAPVRHPMYGYEGDVVQAVPVATPTDHVGDSEDRFEELS